MEALQRQEDILKNKLEDASTITERRQIRGELRDIRRKIQEFGDSKDENANTILPKHEINGNKTSVDVTKSNGPKVQDENSINEVKSSSGKSGVEYRINDDTPDVKVKSADERANRRAKRQERMARLAKEQTSEDTSKVLSTKDEKVSQEKNEKTSLSNGINTSKGNNESTPKTNAEKEDKKEMNRPWSQRFGRDAPKNETTEAKKSNEIAEVKNSTTKPYVSNVERKVDVKTTSVDTPSSLVSKTERKEERTFMQNDKQSENIKQTVEQRSVIENKQQTTHTTKTTNRFSNSLDRQNDSAGQNGPQNDKQKAAKTIGKALNVGALRNKFTAAEQKSPAKPADLGLNFSKKFDQPGYTVKKFAEIKTEQKTTTNKPAEFGTSFLGSRGQNQAGTRSNLRETGFGSNYKKTTPEPHPRHQTAPAAPAGNAGFSMPGGGSGGASVADRMKLFREAQEQEKAREQKQKEKEQHRARLASDPTGAKIGPPSNTNSSTENRTAPCLKKREKKKPVRRTMSISSIVLDWCKEMVKDYGINITNFSSSWSSGLAFCALIHKFNPDKFDFNELNATDRERNFTLAFDTAFEVKKIPKLLDVEDMVRMEKPEPRSVQCYVQWIWSVYGPTSGYGPSQEEIKQAAVS